MDILLVGGVCEACAPTLKPARPLAADIHLCCFGLDFHPHVVEIESWSGQGCGFLRLSGNRQRKSQDKQCPNGPADSDADHIPQARSMNHQISSRTDPILKPSGNVCHRNKLMLQTLHFWMAGPGRRIYDSVYKESLGGVAPLAPLSRCAV